MGCWYGMGTSSIRSLMSRIRKANLLIETRYSELLVRMKESNYVPTLDEQQFVLHALYTTAILRRLRKRIRKILKQAEQSGAERAEEAWLEVEQFLRPYIVKQKKLTNK